jgi:hypothetical protein
MLPRSKKRAVIFAAIFVFIVLVVVPYINIEKYRGYVASSLSQALGRNVTVESVELKTLPVPGLLLKGVVIADDPSISAEPMLRDDAPEGVLATLRISSLWRARLEIATLKLRYPSLNLVRASDGRWNIESVLERVRQTPAAPTATKRPEARTRFPYIEATGGRINLKVGQEKKVFALGDADFALWAPAENEWRMRLEARPLRTDANLSDTGAIKIEGSWKRADQLRDTPLNFRFWWEDGQLGQLTLLIYGSDMGWRGGVRVSGLVLGTPENLKIVTDARLDDFRRYDIATSEALPFQSHCDAFYSVSQHLLHHVYCQAPTGGGIVIARGSLGTGSSNRSMDLTISAENVSARFLATLTRHVKKDIPEDVQATGSMNSTLTVRAKENGVRTWAGSGSTSAVQLRSSVLQRPLNIDPVHWSLVGPGTDQALVLSGRNRAAKPPDSLPPPPSPAFKFDPVPIAAGGTSPLTLRGWFTRTSFFAELKGDADVQRLFQIARLAGLPTTASDLSGSANGALRLSGSFREFKPPTYIVDAQLQQMTARISGVASPVSIRSAQFVANETAFVLSKATMSIPGLHSDLALNVTWPKECASGDHGVGNACAMKFDLTADQLNVDEVNSLLNPKAQKRPWYAAIANTVLASSKRSFPEVRATGKVSAGKLIVKGIPAAHFTADLSLSPDGFSLGNAAAEVFGGKYSGELRSDFRGDTPVYISEGKLQNLALNYLSTWMRDDWASGKVSFSYQGKAAGWNAGELLSSAVGVATFEWRDGTLRHIELDSTGKPLQFRVFAGALELKNRALAVTQSKLQTAKSIYQVSGTASLGRELEFRLARDGAPVFSISGPLQRPKVAPLKLPQTQADLANKQF